METNELQEKSTALSLKATSFKIKTDDDMKIAADELRGIKAFKGKINDFFDSDIKKAHSLHKGLVAKKKQVLEPVLETEKIWRTKSAGYLAEQEKLRLAEEKRLREEAEAKAAEDRRKEQEALKAEEDRIAKAKAEAEALEPDEDDEFDFDAQCEQEESEAAIKAAEDEAEIKRLALAKPVVVERVKLNKATYSGVTSRKVWKWRVTDLSLVPREYLRLDERALNSHAKKSPEEKVPGVEFYSEDAVSVR